MSKQQSTEGAFELLYNNMRKIAVRRMYSTPMLGISHGLRGSGSPVLTATGFVNGKEEFSTPYRIDTPQSITKNLSQVITSVTPTAKPNSVHIRPRGLLGKIIFIYTP